MDKVLPISRFHTLITNSVYGPPRWMAERIWTTAPRSYFASDRVHRRWNARFAGQPIAETPGAFRVGLIETPRGRERWHVEITVGAQRFSLSSHDDREAAERDARSFSSGFDNDALRVDGESPLDAAWRLARLYVTAMPKRARP